MEEGETVKVSIGEAILISGIPCFLVLLAWALWPTRNRCTQCELKLSKEETVCPRCGKAVAPRHQ